MNGGVAAFPPMTSPLKEQVGGFVGDAVGDEVVGEADGDAVGEVVLSHKAGEDKFSPRGRAKISFSVPQTPDA